MVSPAITQAGTLQLGVETTGGTAVAATRRLFGSVTWTDTEEEVDSAGDNTSGSRARTVRRPVTTRRRTDIVLEAPADLDQLLYILAAALGQDGVQPVEILPTGGAYEWTFGRLPSVAEAASSLTFEYRETDLTDQSDVRATFARCSELVFRFGVNEIVAVGATFAARAAVSNAITAGLAAVDDPAVIAGPALHVLLGSAIGAQAEVINAVYGGELTIQTGQAPGWYHGGPTDGSLSTWQLVPRSWALTLNAVFDPTAATLIPQEAAAKAAKSVRYLTLRGDGAAFAAPNDATNSGFEIGLTGIHLPDSMASRGTDRDGNTIRALSLASIDDRTNKDIEILLRNRSASL